MPNTTSAKKALRQSQRKRAHNLFWKNRIKEVTKNINNLLSDDKVDADIIKKEESLFYKVVDKAAKNNVIHKNKAKRIKSRISHKISQKVSAHASSKGKSKSKSESKS